MLPVSGFVCVSLVKMMVPGGGRRPNNQLGDEANRKLYCSPQLPTLDPTRIHWQPESTPGSNWIPLQRGARTKLMPHPVDLSLTIIKVCGGQLLMPLVLPVLTVLTCWPAASGGWVEQKVALYVPNCYGASSRVILHCCCWGSGVKPAWPTLSNFWITLKDTWRILMWPGSVYLYLLWNSDISNSVRYNFW